MQRFDRISGQALLLRLAVILTGLLIILASIALLYIFVQIVSRFGTVVTLFTLGAIVAYVVNPAVNYAAAFLGRRWAGTLVVYVAVAAFLVLLIVLLTQPLVSQSSALVSALNNPSRESLSTLREVANRAALVEASLRKQASIAAHGATIPLGDENATRAQILALQQDVAAFQTQSAVQASAKPARQSSPQPQTRIPPSYLGPLDAPVAALQPDYARALEQPRRPTLVLLMQPVADAADAASAAAMLRRTVSVTPVVILDAQAWADDHHLTVNVQARAGNAVKKITDQATSILSNTAGIVGTTGAVLVDATLVLLISLYFVSDGAHMIRRGLGLIPDRYKKQATFFVESLDTVLGQSIRANIACAAIAGVLGGTGALVLGVPYAVLIGVSTAVLQLIPIIGAIVLMIPPVAIALLFTTPTKAIVLLVWYIVFEQIVTNVIGPRLTSKTVGIHPLEAMAAALVGYPLAGFLGSFFAVPAVGLTHVLVKQALAARKDQQATQALRTHAAESPASERTQSSPVEAAASIHARASGASRQ